MWLEKTTWFWFVLFFSCIVLMEWLEHDRVVVPTVFDALALPDSTRFSVWGEVSHPRFRSGALVFVVQNRGEMTCYFRHPPSLLMLFPRDGVVVHGHLTRTPQGRLCIVERLESAPHALES